MLSNHITVPFIEKTILDISYAREILKGIDASLCHTIKEVPIEQIITRDGITIKIEAITKDKNIHGMLVCDKSDIDLWDEEKNKLYTIFCNGKTIYIDNLLLGLSMKNRYRFTLAHEYAHWILHRKIVKRIAKERKILPYLTCEERNINEELIDKVEVSCEWQANYLAGAILMPYLPIKYYCKENNFYNLNEDFLKEQIRILASRFSVSIKAMYVRLRQLGYIETTINEFEKK